MKYFVMLAGDGDVGSWNKLSPEQQQAVMGQFAAFDEACEKRSGVELLGGEALEEASMSTTVRTRNGELTVTDGPYTEATEQIGGFYLVDAPELDTMIELCRVLPAYDIEIRPVVDFG